MKLWAELLELAVMVLITFATIIGGGLICGYLLGWMLGVS
jgi:hypothetical protein